MKTRPIVFVAALLTICCIALPASAQKYRPALLQLSIYPPVQLQRETKDIAVYRLGIVSKNHRVSGLDIGIVAQTTGDLYALQLSAVSITKGDANGVMLSLANIAEGKLNGVQLGAYNRNAKGMAGFQLGIYNDTPDVSAGVQLGVVNNAKDMTGIQLGLFNYCETLAGIQIGLINVVSKKDVLPIFPIVNGSF